VVGDLVDARRSDPPFVEPERPMLDAWLEHHRVTLLLKVEGLDEGGLRTRPVPTSLLSLQGIVRHMAEVERSWFRRVLAPDPDLPKIWPGEDRDLFPLDGADWAADLATWQAECAASRAAAAGRSLDDLGLRHGEPCSLRWIYLHMIEEYARHNGHADLIRELVDGTVGA
jgi:Protein of unknown function (DUF664)